MNHSNPVLNPLEKIGKTNSVSSLSVGVQYDLRDVVSEEHLDHHRESLRSNHSHHRRSQTSMQHQHPHHSTNPRYTATAVEYIPSNGLRGSVHSRKNNFHHVSAPDFQRYTGDRSNLMDSTSITGAAHHPRHHSHHRHHHLHHIHHKSSAQGGTRTLQPRNYEPYYSGFGSLGRAGTYRSTAHPINTQLNHGSLSESDPDMQVGQNWTNHDLHPPPVKTARLSNDQTPKRASATTSRRYGSIRVAECSFIEAGGSQPSTPTSASIVEAVGGGKHHFAYNRNQYFEPDPSAPSLPPPNTTTTGRICNGPLSVGLAAAAAASAAYAASGSSRGSNGQHSHIIPPPQNFCNNGDFATAAPLTTTRIGSTINLASRMTDFYSQQQHQSRHQRSDSPPF